MRNSESFVSPNRGGGTGAAAILNPSQETDRFIDSYKSINKEQPDAYYDSLGNDIRKGLDGGTRRGIINVDDRLLIDNEKNNYIDYQANLYRKGKGNVTPEEYKENEKKKQYLIDLTSKAVMDDATYAKLSKELVAKDYKYDVEKGKKILEEWKSTPLNQRSATVELPLIDQSNYIKIYKDFGGKRHIAKDINGSFIDGTGSKTQRVSFNEKGAGEDFETIVRVNPNTANMKRVFAVAAEQAQVAAAQQELDWNQLPNDVRKEMIFEQAKDNYVEAMRSTLTPQTDFQSRTNTKEETEEETAAKKTKAKTTRTPAQMANAFTIEGKVNTENGEVKRVVNLNLLGLENKDKDNVTQNWRGGKDGTKSVTGKAQRVIQEEGGQPFIQIAAKDEYGVPSYELVPYVFNKEKIINDYQVDFVADRPKDFNSKYDNFMMSRVPARGADEEEEDYNDRVKKLLPIIDKFNNRKKTTPAKATTKATTTPKNSWEDLGGKVRGK